MRGGCDHRCCDKLTFSFVNDDCNSSTQKKDGHKFKFLEEIVSLVIFILVFFLVGNNTVEY